MKYEEQSHAPQKGLGLFMQHLRETKDNCPQLNLMVAWVQGLPSSCQPQTISKSDASKPRFLSALQLRKTLSTIDLLYAPK